MIPENSLQVGPLKFSVPRSIEIFEFFRPEGDFYWNIWLKILEECKDAPIPEGERDAAIRALTAIILTTAARTQVVDRPLEVLHLPLCKKWRPVCDVEWAKFELFRTTNRFFDEIGIPFPEEISNARRVFGIRMLQGVKRWKEERRYWKSKDSAIKAFREHRKSIKSGGNPYSIDDDFHMFILLETISSAPAYQSNWANSVKRARKEMDHAFNGYVKALAAMANAIDRGFDGENFHLIDQNSKLISERGRRRSLKPLTG